MVKKAKKNSIQFPSELLVPVRELLRSQLKLLKLRRKNIMSEDPFSDPERALDNAATDTEAEEQFGHDMAQAMKFQLEEKIAQTKEAINRVKNGEYGMCAKCGKMINTDRLMVYPEATLCMSCKEKSEK